MVRKIGKKRTTGKKVGAVKRRRRRRIGAMDDMGKSLEQYLAVGIGAVVGREIAVMAGNMFPSLQANPLVFGLGEMAVAYVIPKFVKGPFMANAALGMAGNGFVTAVVATGIITGVNDGPNRGGAQRAYQIGGTANLPMVNGVSNLPVVNGVNRIMSMPTPSAVGASRRYSPFV